ncbi:MAG: multicopper oxidase family protein [Hyphomicrobiales bacterium]
MRISRREILKSIGATSFIAATPRIARAETPDSFIVLNATEATAPIGGTEYEPTAVWAYDGTVPGPVIRAKQGEELRVRFTNNLSQPSSVHWHGIRIANAMDGVAGLTQAPVQQGESFDYIFTPPDAGTYWYHPHARTWEQLARGLYGMLIVEERTQPAFDADIALMVDDWRLDDKGAIHEASFKSMRDWSHAGRLGNWLTVNGQSQPKFEVPAGGRSRLRIANASNARVMSLVLLGGKVTIIALDGQPVPPQLVDEGETIEIAPAQRVDVMLAAPDAIGEEFDLAFKDRAEKLKIASFKTVAPLTPLKHGSIVLPDNPIDRSLDLADAQQVDLVMEGGAMGAMREAIYKGEKMDIRALVAEGKVWAFNGIVGRDEKPFFSAMRGRTVSVNMVNQTSWPHAIHFHGHHFLVIERDGKPVEEPAWRDTVLMAANERIKIAFKADNPGKWMVHCHMLEHQAAGMAAWFEVA